MHEETCPTCGGQGCEEGCGNCQMAHAGPESHKVCRDCQGRGTHEVPDEPVKHMDLGEFRELGFLQEANRQFFHPLGLALEWDTGWTRKGLEEFIVRKMKEQAAAAEEDPDEVTIEDAHPDTINTIWQFIQHAGLDKPRISGVWDYRDDPEGMRFNWDRMPHDEVREKAYNIDVERARHVAARHEMFGGIVQELP